MLSEELKSSLQLPPILHSTPVAGQPKTALDEARAQNKGLLILPDTDSLEWVSDDFRSSLSGRDPSIR